MTAPRLKERKFYLLDGYAGHGQADQAAAQESQALYKNYDALLKPRRAAADPTAWLYGSRQPSWQRPIPI
jgi:hypothetical protein